MSEGVSLIEGKYKLICGKCMEGVIDSRDMRPCPICHPSQTLYAIKDSESGEYVRFWGGGGVIYLHTSSKYFDVYYSIDEPKGILESEKGSIDYGELKKENLKVVPLTITEETEEEVG